MKRSVKTSSFVPMAIVGTLFFIFGFVTWLNGSLIPFLKIICNLNEYQALFVTFAFYIAYTVMALPMSYLLDRTGYKNGMALGLAIMAVGSLLFIPAAQSANFMIFLAALFTLGSGLTILQTASNPYIVHIGPKESAAMRISIMGLINKSAGVLAPMLFSALIFSGMADFSADSVTAEEIEELSSRLILPYIYMAAVLTALIGLIKFSSLPEIDLTGNSASDSENKTGIIHFPQVVLGAAALFFYVGVEVIAGDTIGLYGQKLGITDFSSLTSYTMVFMVAGYIIGVVAIPRFITQEKALLGSAIAGILFLLGAVFGSSESTVVAETLWGFTGIATVPDTITFVALMGLANALVWPTIWPLALEGLGKQTAQGSALLIMGIAGGALIPLLFGKAAQLGGDMQTAYLVALPCYLFILFYAVKGHKIRSWR